MNVIRFFKVFRRDFSDFIQNMDSVQKLHYLAYNLRNIHLNPS